MLIKRTDLVGCDQVLRWGARSVVRAQPPILELVKNDHEQADGQSDSNLAADLARPRRIDFVREELNAAIA